MIGKCLRAVFFLGLYIGIYSLLTGCSANTPGNPKPAPAADRLAAPVLPENPSQADQGALVYYQICMSCHGDRGQGLTEEWRLVWEEDYNCWKSGCHGSSPPPWGFKLPEDPAQMGPVIGPGTLGRFRNAQELYAYIYAAMPWWNPGSLTVEQTWQVTAFLMRENGALPDGTTLGPENASLYPLHLAGSAPVDSSTLLFVIGSTLFLSAGLLFIEKRRTR